LDATAADFGVVRVEFSVQDTGAGIAKSEQSKLWLPFVRVGKKLILLPSHGSLTNLYSFKSVIPASKRSKLTFFTHAGNEQATSGTGLGLFISKVAVYV
jgi:signal transduction histidine kinase